MARTVYVSIGNSDDKLTQAEWHDFATTVETLMSAFPLHGAWYSRPDSDFQNACWCIDLTHINVIHITALKTRLGEVAKKYRQDSIAWAEATTTFLPRPTASESGEVM